MDLDDGYVHCRAEIVFPPEWEREWPILMQAGTRMAEAGRQAMLREMFAILQEDWDENEGLERH